MSAFSLHMSGPDPAMLLLGKHPRKRKTCPHKNLYKIVYNNTVHTNMETIQIIIN